MHNKLVQIVIGCVLLGAVLTILQIWTQFISWDDFIKITTTLGIVIVAIGFVLVAKSDFSEHKKMKDENYLD
jgi:uncharacterized membrane protein